MIGKRAIALALPVLLAAACVPLINQPGPAGTVISRHFNRGHCSGSKKRRTCTSGYYAVRVTSKGQTRRIRVNESTYWACPANSRWPACSK